MADWIVPWIDFLRWEFVRQGAYKPGEEYNWAYHETAPFCPLKKPIEDCKVTFWSMAGARTKDQDPWEKEILDDWGWRNDLSYREIPRNTDINDLIYKAGSYAYDAKQDPNLIFPLDRFRELEEDHFGELSQVVFSSNATFKKKDLSNTTAPKALKRLKELKVDAVVFIAL